MMSNLEYNKAKECLSYLSDMLLRRLNDKNGRVRYCGRWRATVETGQILFEATKLKQGILVNFQFAEKGMEDVYSRMCMHGAPDHIDDARAEMFADAVFEGLLYMQIMDKDKNNYLTHIAERASYPLTVKLMNEQKKA